MSTDFATYYHLFSLNIYKLSCADSEGGGGGAGGFGPPPPRTHTLKNHKAAGLLSNTCPDPLKNHKAM